MNTEVFGTIFLDQFAGSGSGSGRLTLTLLSRGRGSGASSAPSSTRQVEGRRASAPAPLPADISEPPLSATQLRQRPQHRAAQPSRPAHCAARAAATLTAAQCGREAPLYLERGKRHAHGARAQSPGALTGAVGARAIPRPFRELQQEHESCEPSRTAWRPPSGEGSPARGGRGARQSAASAAGGPPARRLSARARRPRHVRASAVRPPCCEFKAPHLLPIVKCFCLETATYVTFVKHIRLFLILT